MRYRIVCAIAIFIVSVSWLGNYIYYRSDQLPAPLFLKHHIEVSARVGTFFELAWVANSSEKRTISRIWIDELPEVQFSPPSVHMQLRHQTISRMTGTFVSSRAGPTASAEPLLIHEINVAYNDGTSAKVEIGDIWVSPVEAADGETDATENEADTPSSTEPKATPGSDAGSESETTPAPASASEPPYVYTSAGGDSNGGGSQSISFQQPLTLERISSVLLKELGDSLKLTLIETVPREPDKTLESLPAALPKGTSLKTAYRFQFAPDNPQAMEVYSLELKADYTNLTGQTVESTTFINYMPYPTESAMRQFVREQRRAVR